VQGMIII